eukprot:8315026-Lingulodinium_polyedra.AAC.1
MECSWDAHSRGTPNTLGTSRELPWTPAGSHGTPWNFIGAPEELPRMPVRVATNAEGQQPARTRAR